MRRLERLLAALACALAAAPACAQYPAALALDEVLRLAERSPRITASQRDADVARAERDAADKLPNPSLSLGYGRPAGGERTIFDANSQQLATVDLPVPVFGQRGARVRAAEQQVGRAESALRLTVSETRRLAALAFVRLLAAQEHLAARSAARREVERIGTLAAGRLQSGVASRYDKARADAELALVGLAVQRAQTDLREQAAALAGVLAAPAEWQPRAEGSLQALQGALGGAAASELAEDSPAARLARDEARSAEARVELAQRERYPVPSLSLGRTWTDGPFGAANFVGVASEIPILDTRRAQVDKAQAEAESARERERGTRASLQAEYQRHRDTLRLRRDALARFDREVFERQAAFLEMAESAYRLGRGTMFELLDAHRTQLEAATARIELLGGIVESEIELRALAGKL
jgi:cobalt-zinc-cadmium efflux system outer membrane protein